MSYSTNLARRLRENRKRAKPNSTAAAPPEAGFVHPGRYPKHADPAKGQVYGGECNRTACMHRNAIFWNRYTYGLYCPSCAQAINFDPNGQPVCFRVSSKPVTQEQMEAMR